MTPETLESIRSMVAAEGADAWFEKDAVEFLPPGTSCADCGSLEFYKEEDIVDVWFESGISHLAVLRSRPDLHWPADLYVEGSDQHRGWFQSSLLLSVGFSGKPPYGAVLTHGFTVDGAGRKMSKSLGNAIDPREVYNRSGADILRLWTATTDYSSDIPVSEEILSRVTEAYRRIRNTLRFLLGNTFDYDPEADAVPITEMEEIDRWMLSRLQGLTLRVTDLMERWLFHQAIQALHLFCTVDLSSLYLDILKDRLYTFSGNSKARRSAQTALHRILLDLTAMIAPVLAHTAEEALWAMPEGLRPAESVHLMPWPSLDESLVDAALDTKWERLLAIREEVYRKLEDARQEALLGTSLEALVQLYASGEDLRLLQEMDGELPAFFIVSQVRIEELSAFTGERVSEGAVEVIVERSGGDKCQRCWNYRPTVGADEDNPDICDRCVHALADSER